MKSWKTTASGVLLGISMVFGQVSYLFDDKPETNCDWSIVMAGLGAIALGISARDNRVTSEAAGAK